MADEIDATIERLHQAGASDSEIASLIKEKYGYRPDPTMQGNAAQAINERRGGFPRPPSSQRDDSPDGDPSLINKLVGGMDSLAHPTSATDLAALAIPNALGGIGELSAPSIMRGGLRMLKAGSQAAGEGSAVSAPMRFIRGAYQSLRDAPKTVEAAQTLNYNKLPLAAQEASSTGAWDDALRFEQDLPKGPSQAVYTKLPDGRWALKAAPGHTLTEGASVHAMNRAGTGTMHTVGPLTPEGFAPLSSHEATTLGMTGGSGYSIPDEVQARVMEILRRQGRQ